MASLSRFGLFVLLLHIVSPSKTNPSSDALMNIPARLVALEQTMAIIVGELQEDRSSSNKKFILKEDIVATINQGSFAIAEEKMIELHDPAIVADIVRDMANSDHDFGVLVNLAKSVNNTSLKTHILTNLYHKAKESDHISTPNLIVLAKCLSEKGKGYQNDRVIRFTSFKKLLDLITENTIATFLDVMIWQEDYQTNSEVRTLAADIAEWRDVSQKVMIGLVSRVFGTVDSKKILEAVSNHTDAWQALVGVDAVIERLKDTNSFQGGIALDIASHLNEIMTRKNLNSTVGDYDRRVNYKITDCIVKLMSLRTGVLGTVDSKQILQTVNDQSDALQALMGADALIERLKDTNSFQGGIALDIASHLNEIMTRKVMNSTVEEYARTVKAKIPDCIEKLTILTNVCFWNNHSKSFLTESTEYYANPLSSVILRPRIEDTNTQKRAAWTHERKDVSLFFRNVRYHGNLLQASNNAADGFNRVFSTAQKGDLADKNAWVIEPAGDSCFLKNCWNNEYLFASEVRSKRDDAQIAGTKDKRSGSADNNPEFAWQIVSC